MRKFVLYFCLFLCTVACSPPLPTPQAASPTALAAVQSPTSLPPTPTATPSPTITVTASCVESCITPMSTATLETPSPTATPTYTPEPTATPEPTLTPSPTQTSQPGSVNLAFVGDIMLARRLGQAILAGDVAYPFGEVDEVLRSADFTIGNLETALASDGVAAAKAYRFISPPEAAPVLADAGFDLMTLANNHALDFGAGALHEGIALLAAENIAAIGAGRNSAEAHAPHIVTIHGVTIGFLSYVNVPVEWRGFDTAVWTATESETGVAWGTSEGISADVRALTPIVDHAIVILHSGYEYVRVPSPIQHTLSHAAINAGATLVVGHHAHVVQGVERTGDGTIAYGLGNFAFDVNEASQSVILHITLEKDGLTHLSFTPIAVQVDGRPVIIHESQPTVEPEFD